jgi:hypothetical protein
MTSAGNQQQAPQVASQMTAGQGGRGRVRRQPAVRQAPEGMYFMQQRGRMAHIGGKKGKIQGLISQQQAVIGMQAVYLKAVTYQLVASVT